MSSKTDSDGQHLIVVGGGSAAFAAAIKASGLGARVTLINDGLPIGGTCVNVGCVPSKTLLRAAQAYYRAGHPGFEGLVSEAKLESFASVIAQKNDLVRQLRGTKYEDIAADLPNVRIVEGRARLCSSMSVEVGGETIGSDRILIATGARPAIPPIPGLAESGFLTNETAFELEELPESLIVLGGRYVALEIAQLFARLGTHVTVLQRSSRILPALEPDLTAALTGFLRQEGLEIVTGVSISDVTRTRARVRLEAGVGDQRRAFEASHLLAALGRTPNTGGMGLETVGVALTADGFIEVDSALGTSVPGIVAAGDVIGDPMFVYTAAYEGALAAANALTPNRTERDYTALPWVVFTDPQVAGVGLDERQAREAGIAADATTLPLEHVPRALAARDTRGFIRLVRDRQSNRLIGARILAAEGSELLMQVSQAIKFGIDVQDIVSSFYPYLTLSEGIKLAAISFDKDVAALSCCSA